MSTTMGFVRLLSKLCEDKKIGKYIVPIVPDESRTFGMEGMFKDVGIYAHAGQLYEPVDRKSLRNTKGGLFKSPFAFKQYGQCGKWVSDIFPHVGECVDDICFDTGGVEPPPVTGEAIVSFNVEAGLLDR